jgi:hypothetical protein
MWLAVGLSLAAVAVIVLVRVWETKTQRGRRAIFLQRSDMLLPEMHQRFYSDSAITEAHLERALGDIAKHLGVPATRLRPTDRFDTELAPTPGWTFDDEMADLEWIAQDSLRNHGVDPLRVSFVRTVDDYVRVVSGDVARLRLEAVEK